MELDLDGTVIRDGKREFTLKRDTFQEIRSDLNQINQHYTRDKMPMFTYVLTHGDNGFSATLVLSDPKAVVQ